MTKDKLVKGYVITKNTGEHVFETLYCITQSQRIFQSSEHFASNQFVGRWSWVYVTSMPETAEFIGQYPYPHGVYD